MKDKILKILIKAYPNFASNGRVASEIESLIEKNYITIEEYILMRDDRNNTIKAFNKSIIDNYVEKEFVKWKDEHCDPVQHPKYKGYYHVDWLYYPNNEANTFEEVYNYWQQNIKDK